MSSPSPDILSVDLLTPSPELGIWLCEDAGCQTEDAGLQVATVSDRRVGFRIVKSEEDLKESPSICLPVVVMRFVDVLSLQDIRGLLEAGTGRVPSMVLIYRNENEMDFKMSCPYCGQKLWVRDADKDKRGRCPHCHKGFTLPSQEEHVSLSLSLPSHVPVRRIVRHDPASLGAPMRLLMELAGSAQTLKGLDKAQTSGNDTMRVNVED